MFAASTFGMMSRLASTLSRESDITTFRTFLDNAVSPRISPSTSKSGERARISSSASRIFCADGASELPKFECESSATLGTCPKRFTSSAASIVISAICAAVDNGNFKTLAAALGQAGLVDTLKGKGPFTVFAPTDAAFAKLPKEQLDALLADKAQLSKVLTYHVVPGLVLARDVKPGAVKTVEGSALTVRAEGGRVMVDNATVTTTDVRADNGVIHVIDAVLLPGG